jgi:uncharacterized protein YajQ (UPF0234 family)
MIDTGKDDERGRPITIDPSKLDLTRRGARITGIEAAMEGIKAGDPVDKVLGRMSGDVLRGALHPWEGPPVRIVEEWTKKFAETGDYGKAAKSGLMAVNPTVTAALDTSDSSKPGGVKGVAAQLGSSVGFGKGHIPRHEETIEYRTGKPVESMDMHERIMAERQLKASRKPMSAEESAKAGGRAIASEVENGQEVQKRLPKEQQKWLKERSLHVTGFSDKVHMQGTDVVLTGKELDRYKALVQEQYITALDKVRARFDDLNDSTRHVYFNSMMSNAKLRARGQLEREMKSGSINEPDKKKKGLFSVFSPE